ncbi:MAG: ABC-F family ATP-binding cassette domain-containing protein [Lachnospiraceae bacterium]|nr:ABC-F family ATP-binding cassette domain-containing protein [Lachnospiraceae bacterium]
MLLACRGLKKTFVAAPVLSGGYFHIEEKEKAAVVGINGAGKSTLLNLITGQLAPDEGEVIFTKGRTMGYLTQHQGLETDRSIYEEIASAKAEVFAMEESLRTLEQQMKTLSGEELDLAMERYSRTLHEFEAANGYALKSEITGIIKGLGFSEEEARRPAGVLSGGEKTRVALGRLLLSRPDLILLDEPTNHLDIASVAWLEGYLKDYPGAVIVVSHDRYFLDRVVTKVIEVENGTVSMFTGNYSAYAEKKQQLRAAKLQAWKNQQQEIRHQEEVIAKLKSFNREKSIKRAESREKMLEKIERLEKPKEIRDAMHFSLEPHEISGGDVLEIRGLSKQFGSQVLFNDLSADIKRGEHVGLIGENGAGKSTILKIINGLTAPDAGSVKLGVKVTVGYYDQEQQLLTDENTLFNEIRSAYPGMTDSEVRGTLAAFLFTGDDVFKLVRDLSGGERGRLSLAKLILSPCNFLILDEPTNHLDITSREILEDALSRYSGTVLAVSHDRYFLNRVATRILELDNGSLHSYLGNYDDCLAEKARQKDSAAGTAAGSAGDDGRGKSAADPAPASLSDSALERKAKKEAETIRRRRENELKRTESSIEELEARSAQIDALFEDEAIATDLERVTGLSKEKEAIAAKLNELYAKWEELSS